MRQFQCASCLDLFNNMTQNGILMLLHGLNRIFQVEYIWNKIFLIIWLSAQQVSTLAEAVALRYKSLQESCQAAD